MKQAKRLIALIAVVAMLMTLCVAVGAEEVKDEILASENFEGFTDIPQGESYIVKNPYRTNGLGWNYGIASALSKAYLVNDANSIDGQYLIFDTYPDKLMTEAAYFLVGPCTMTKDFNFDYCFGTAAKRPDGGDWSMPPYNLHFYDAASYPSGNRSGAGKLITFTTASNKITVVNDNATADYTYNFTQGKWYDIRVKGHVPANGTPTYDLLIKEHGAENYTAVATGLSFPTSGNWAGGVGCQGVISMGCGWDSRAIALDNVKLYYPAPEPTTDCTITFDGCTNGTLSLPDGAKSVVPSGSSVTVNVTPDPFCTVNKVLVNGVSKPVTDNKVTFTVYGDTKVEANCVRANTQYLQTYSALTVESGTYNVYNAGRASNGWALNLAGNYNKTFLVNDSLNKVGNYLSADSYSANVYSLTDYGDEGFAGSDTGLKFTNDTNIEFSFMHRYSLPNTTDAANGTNLNLCLYPAASYPKGDRNGAGACANISSNGHITSSLTNQDGEYAFAHNTWYDVKVKLVDTTSAPHYNIYLKKSADKDYQLMLENVALPSGNYANGVGTYGMLMMPGSYTTFALDDIQIYSNATADVITEIGANGTVTVGGVENDTHFEVAKNSDVTAAIVPAEGYAVDEATFNGEDLIPSNGNDYLFNANADGTLKVTFKKVEAAVVNASDYESIRTDASNNADDQGDYYAMRFLFALSVPEGADAVTDMGAYFIPFDLFKADSYQADGRALVYSGFTGAPADGDIFSADLMKIPAAQIQAMREIYAVPFVNSKANLDAAYHVLAGTSSAE